MRRSVGAVLLVGHLTVGAAAAQTVSATMGAIDGRVTDHTNAVLPGVTVTISGPTMMGTRVVTTNEEVRALHPAVARPGRCASLMEFTRMSADESRVWLAGRNAEAEVNGAMSLASLFALAEGYEPGSEPERRVGFASAHG